MDFWVEIFTLMIKTMALALISPLFWLVVALVFLQYRRAVSMEKQLFGRAINNVWRQTFYSMLFGLLGGFFGSVFLIVLGISLESIGIFYLWPVAIMLMMINPRFLCFAYAGGIVAVVSLILQWMLPFLPGLEEIWLVSGLLNIYLPSLLTLVGILHLTEAFLIYFSGHRGASPIYLKSPSTGEIVGGYSMQRFWPLPLMGLWAQIVTEGSEMLVGSIAMPEWWPLLGTVMEVGGDERVIYFMVPIVAGLGYSDLALSSYPQKKRQKSALNLALYSLVLSSAAISAAFVPAMVLPAALLAPLGHEYLIKKGNDEEFSNPPLFRSRGEAGLKVMAVIPESPAGKAGLMSGDTVLEVNGFPVEMEVDFWEQLRMSYFRALLKVKRETQVFPLPVQIYPQPISNLGVVFAPRAAENVYVEMKHNPLWKRLTDRFSRRKG